MIIDLTIVNHVGAYPCGCSRCGWYPCEPVMIPLVQNPVQIRKAAECGHVEAMICLGVEWNDLEWLKKAIENGDEEEKSRAKRALLSLHLEQGKIEEALSCVENPGHYMFSPESLKVGKALLYGNGIKKDIDKAIYYLERAAVSEDQACFLLAQICLSPEKGKQDIDEAISWIEKIEDMDEVKDSLLNLLNNNKGTN